MEAVARQPRRAMSGDTAHEDAGVPPPAMLRQPADQPAPLRPIRDDDRLVSMHRTWARRDTRVAAAQSPWQRLGRAGRASVDRFTGREDAQLLAELIRAVDAVAARCDELAQRLARAEAVLEDVATTYGAELAGLRAELAERSPARRPDR